MIGRLTRDLELKTTKSGKSVCEFSLAVEAGKDQTDFIDCIAFDTLAENLATYQQKGNRIAVQGSIKKDVWKNKDGENRSKTYVRANVIKYLSEARKTDAEQNQEHIPNFTEVDEDLPF